MRACADAAVKSKISASALIRAVGKLAASSPGTKSSDRMAQTLKGRRFMKARESNQLQGRQPGIARPSCPDSRWWPQAPCHSRKFRSSASAWRENSSARHPIRFQVRKRRVDMRGCPSKVMLENNILFLCVTARARRRWETAAFPKHAKGRPQRGRGVDVTLMFPPGFDKLSTRLPYNLMMASRSVRASGPPLFGEGASGPGFVRLIS